MEILLWLVPAAVVTVAAMLWVGWLGREGRGEIDRETALRRLGEALQSEQPRTYAVPGRVRDRSTGIAVRPAAAREAGAGSSGGRPDTPRRRVS